jgi:hypothetical protein
MSAVMLEKTERLATISEEKILNMLWCIVNEPKNYLKVKVLNVFDNAYRINVWSEYNDEVHNITCVKISHSYFCKLINQELVVLS